MLMSSNKEVEIKFRISDLRDLTRRLRKEGFQLRTPRTHEMNTVYDLPSNPLRRRRALLRLRKYASERVLTHKANGKAGRQRTRTETETKSADGSQMAVILRSSGHVPP